MPSRAAERTRLSDGARALSVALDEDALTALQGYLDLLETWSRRVNLVAAASRQDLVERHVLDSLAAVPLVRRCAGPAASVADLGSGAGLPAVPIAAALPRARVTAVEPRRKRVSFLREVSRTCLGNRLEVREERAAELARKRPGSFDVVVSRAAFGPEALPAIAFPLVRAGGSVLAYATAADASALASVEGVLGRPEAYSYEVAGRAFALLLWRRVAS